MTSGEQMTDALNVVYDCVIAKGLAERNRGKVIVEKSKRQCLPLRGRWHGKP